MEILDKIQKVYKIKTDVYTTPLNQTETNQVDQQSHIVEPLDCAN